MKRYSLRLAADDYCWIPIGGFKSWRSYYLALFACWRANRHGGEDLIYVWNNDTDSPEATA